MYLYLNGDELTKEKSILYKQEVIKKYQVVSINSMLISIHGFLDFICILEYKVKLLKMQRKIFVEEDKQLSENEYKRLIKVAKNKSDYRLYMLIQTMCLQV